MKRARILLFGLLCGCSAGTMPEPGAADGDATQGMLGDGGVVAAGDGGTAGSSSPDLAPGPIGYGSVFVFLSRTVTSSVEYRSTTVGATFYETVAPGNTATCSTTTIGECQVSTCSGTSSGVTPPQAAAGNIVVSGGSQSVTLHTTASSHETVTSPTLYWAGGEALSVSSTGATVAAFADNLIVPEQIVVTAPYLPQTGAVAISRALGLTLDWQGGNHGSALFILGASGPAGSTSAFCRYPASQAHAVLGAAVLSMFPAGVASFSASSENRHEQRVGAWQVGTSASFNATYDTGRSVAGQLQLD